MNILVSELPTSVTVNGRDIPINTDFRQSLAILLAFEDKELSGSEKSEIMLRGLFPDLSQYAPHGDLQELTPRDWQDVLERANWFLNGGEEVKDDGTKKPTVFSFTKDANLIYAAFQQTHGTDLQSVDMHWWRFLALFMDLGSETAFCQLTALRKRKKMGKLSKEERAMVRETGELFEVPEMDTRTLEEKEFENEFYRQAKEARAERKRAKEQQ